MRPPTMMFASGSDEGIAKLIGLLVFAGIAFVANWIKQRGEKKSMDVEIHEDARSAHPAPGHAKPRSHTTPPVIAAAPAPLETLLRLSLELDHPRQRRAAEAAPKTRKRELQRLARAIQDNATLSSQRAGVHVDHAPATQALQRPAFRFGTLDAAAIRRAIVMN